MKHIAIRKMFSYFYTTSEEIDTGEFDDKLYELNKEIKKLLSKYGLQSAGDCTSFYGMKKYSITHCDKCGHLMADRDLNPIGFSSNELAEDIEYVIYNGGQHEGKTLCENCLPLTHRWGLHS